MTPSNIWVEKDLRNELMKVFSKRRLDLVPAICKGKEGMCMLSMTFEEVTKVLNSFSRGISINSTGTVQAQIMNTEIVVDVVSVHQLPEEI